MMLLAVPLFVIAAEAPALAADQPGVPWAARMMAEILGGILGSRRDPLAWSLLALGIAFGVARRPWYFVSAAAFIGSVVTVSVVYSWWVELGDAHDWVARSARILLLQQIIGFIGFGLGAAVGALARGRSKPADR